MKFRPDGSIEPICPDEDQGAGTPGVSELTLDAFAAKREAQEFHARLNSDPVPRTGGGYRFAMKNGGYLRFDSMDFGAGGGGFKVAIAGAVPQLKDGRLQIRIDNFAGPVIGEATVEPIASSEVAHILTGPITSVTGVHSVFLVAHGLQGDSEGHLFQVEWFTFTPQLSGH